MNCCCIKSKYCIYSVIFLNILMNLLILTILFLICYNISILNFFQILYLILSILIWILLLLYSFYKLFLIILGKTLEENILKKLWKIVNFPAFSIIGISLIYDLIRVSSKNGLVWFLFYFLSFFFISIIFTFLTIFDYFEIKNQVEISNKKSKAIPLNDLEDPAFGKEVNDNNKDNNINNNEEKNNDIKNDIIDDDDDNSDKKIN